MSLRLNGWMKSNRGFLAFLLFSVLLGDVPASADWISLSGAENAPNIAEIHINRDHVKIELEICVGDVVTFDRLIPDEHLRGIKAPRPPQNERLRAFSREDLQVLVDGQPLIAELRTFEPRIRKDRPSPFAGKINPFTGQPIPGPPQDKRVCYVELSYPFHGLPDSLTFVPPLDKDKANRAAIGFMTYHEGVPLHDFKFFNQPCTVKLDWEDPWYSQFDNNALKRWQTSGVMSYLYIEPYEVRHEILGRVKDLSAWIDLELRGDEFVEADENEALRQRIGEFFLRRDKVVIDGKQLKPILDRVSFVKYSPTASVFVQLPERLPINTTMVGVIITYLTPGIPQEVQSEWDLWSDRIRRVPTDAIDPAGGLPSCVTPDDNLQVWKNFLKQYTIPTVEKVAASGSLYQTHLPIGSMVCAVLLLPSAWWIRRRRSNGRTAGTPIVLASFLVAGSVLLYPYASVSVRRPGSMASRITDEEGTVLVEHLLKNIYRAFDFRREEDVYDKLAVSASGELLTKLYLQNRKSFQVQQAGGAQAKVTEIDVQNVEATSSPKGPLALCLRARWKAMGTVSHWGHIHTRRNQYCADITVEPSDGAWRITGLDILEEVRLDPQVGRPST